MTHLRGKRNPVAFARRVILDFCFKDQILSEKVYTSRTEQILREKLTVEYEGVDEHLYRELGEVMMESRGRGSFQQ